MPNGNTCKVINAYGLQEPTSHVKHTTVADIQLLVPAGYIVIMFPDIKAFGWACKYINDSSIMPYLKWHNSNLGNAH